jgi:1-acyl-sn-glycerol-3-phosphate acyltransferase
MAMAPNPPKPITEIWRPELTRLPPLTAGRRSFRLLVRCIGWVLSALLLKPVVRGIENFPRRGPAILAVNHLGDADSVLLLARLPVAADMLGKIELHTFPVLGWIMEQYGVIWLHRGRPDRRALLAALQGLKEGRIIAVAPEGRYSLIGGLEPGGPGTAFLALRAGVPIVPVALTGTENSNVYGHLRRLRRTPVTLTVGKPFVLTDRAPRRAALQAGTRRVMQVLAGLLPPEYRGAYRDP